MNIFLDKIGHKDYPPKTEEWMSANDLEKDKTFPMGDGKTILSKLSQFQQEIPNYIQIRKPLTGKASLCLYKGGKEEFLKLMQQDKNKSIKQGTEHVNTLKDAQELKDKIKPDDQNEK